MNTEPFASAREKAIAANLAEYKDAAPAMRWVTPQQALEAEAERGRIISSMASHVSWTHNRTKPYYGSLSPGCRICGQGLWSCLFINGKCNCRCFYCPSRQNDIGVPTTNRISFPKPGDYAEYIRRFGFKGVSISGGEPFLTLDRTVNFIETLRDRLGPDLHIWLYTNGTLATAPGLKRLQSAGLNEIRFDISAVDYDISKIEMAAGLIPCVTVEIPAIPEDLERLTHLLPKLKPAGVDFLNLHQLRLTPHNQDQMTPRAYTFLHGEKVTVLESELTALILLNRARQSGLKLSINYCSFVYKHRHQQAAVRRRSAGEILKGHESITEKGYIRSLALVGEPDTLQQQVQNLRQRNAQPLRWLLSAKGDRLAFHESLWPMLDFSQGSLLANYSEALLCAHISYHHEFKEIAIGSTRKIYVEKRPLRLNWQWDASLQEIFNKQVLQSAPTPSGPQYGSDDMLCDYEFLQPGLQDYY